MDARKNKKHHEQNKNIRKRNPLFRRGQGEACKPRNVAQLCLLWRSIRPKIIHRPMSVLWNINLRKAMKREQKPRQRRLDLINNMPTGEQKRIARMLKCSKGYVSSVLNGHTNQDTDMARNIMRLSEHAAAMESGKRFFKSGK